MQTGGPSDNDNADNSNRWATASNNQVLLPRLVQQATRWASAHLFELSAVLPLGPASIIFRHRQDQQVRHKLYGTFSAKQQISYRIFSMYQKYKDIQLVEWYSCLVSLYPASNQCQALRMYPGGCKENIFKIKEWFIECSPWKIKYEACAWMSGKKYFHPMCAIFHKHCVVILLKKRKNRGWMIW